MYRDATPRITKADLHGTPKKKRHGTRSPLKDLADLQTSAFHPGDGIFVFKASIRTVSEANQSQREHWTHKHKRAQVQRDQLHYAWLKVVKADFFLKPPYVITITRIGPKALDSDNLSRSQKAIRDQVAAELKIDDGSELIEWRYTQEPTGKREYAVRIEIRGTTAV